MTVDSVYRMSAQSYAHRTPESYSWEQSIVRYSGSQEDITFEDMDRMAVTSSSTLLACSLIALQASSFDRIGWFECEMPAAAMTRSTGKHGTHWKAGWEVVITLGSVEIKCHVEWEEDVSDLVIR